jgi:hypothetical protein
VDAPPNVREFVVEEGDERVGSVRLAAAPLSLAPPARLDSRLLLPAATTGAFAEAAFALGSTSGGGAYGTDATRQEEADASDASARGGGA